MTMRVRFIRGTALGGQGNDAHPGDVRELPEQDARRLIQQGRAQPATDEERAAHGSYTQKGQMMDTIGDSTITVLQTPARISADGSTAGIDANNLIGHGAFLLTSVALAGTTPTLAVKVQGAADGDKVTSVTAGSNTGTGRCTQVYAGPDAVAETVTVTIQADTTKASVVGGSSGAQAIEATVGTVYRCSVAEFLLTAGATPFIAGDSFAIITTARVWADLAEFAGLTDGRDVEKLPFNFDSAPRFLRVNYDIAGTDSPEYAVTVVAQSATN